MSAEAVAGALREHGFDGASIALVLGSGLGGFAERLQEPSVLSFSEIPDMPRSAVPGHAGRFVFGALGGVRVLVQQGRVHLYEGWRPDQVTTAARAFALLGVRTLILTNAAGGVREAWPPGTLMRIADHLNLTGRGALEGGGRASAGAVYDAGVGARLHAAAEDVDVQLESGVYAGFLGPTYETPAEVRMARWMGADAVGMSTVLEAAAAAAAGMRVGAISCITNQAAGITDEPLSHDEVIETGRATAQRFESLLAAALPRLAGDEEA